MWYGTRIILRQTSAEAVSLFDFIMASYTRCRGDWEQLGMDLNLDSAAIEAFLNYAACFLSNCGNYYVSSPARSQLPCPFGITDKLLGFW